MRLSATPHVMMKVMMRQDADIPLPDGSFLAATVALPDKPAPAGGWPAVMVLHEGGGMTPDTLAAADRFAARGWVAVAPYLFSHGVTIASWARAMREMFTAKSGQVIADIDATRTWLAGRNDVNGERLGVIGFSMGGGFAISYAATNPPGVRAASVNYGLVPKNKQVLRAVCPVIGSFGRRDLAVRAHGVRLEQHLTVLGIEHDVKIYPGAGHTFMTEGSHPIAKILLFPLHFGYIQPAADDAWERTFAFFDRHITTKHVEPKARAEKATQQPN